MSLSWLHGWTPEAEAAFQSLKKGYKGERKTALSIMNVSSCLHNRYTVYKASGKEKVRRSKYYSQYAQKIKVYI